MGCKFRLLEHAIMVEDSEMKIADYQKKIETLTNELTKQKTITSELVKSQTKILEDAIKGAQDIVNNNEETIKTNRKMAELADSAQKTSSEIVKLVMGTANTIEKVAIAAKDVGSVAGQVYENADIAAKASTRNG
jgi:hypothetical protein